MSETTTTASKTIPKKEARPKEEASGTKSASSASETTTTADGGASPASKSTKAKAAAEHSPSYFSSVVSDEYRAGWDSVFAKGNGSATRAKSRKSKNGLPVTIELDPSDLDEEVRSQIESAFRRKAKQQRIRFDHLIKNARVTWRLECEFGE